MIKVVFIAEDDDYVGLKTGDVIMVEELPDEPGYFYTDESGEKFYIAAHEVEEIRKPSRVVQADAG